MKSTLLFLMTILSSIQVFAGFQSKPPMKWGKISPAEFEIVPKGNDANAAAIVLCDYGEIEITNRTFYKRHTRIKILNEDGLRYASVEIPYQTRNRHDVFYDLKAHTLVLENGKVVKYKVESGQIEDIKINDRWSKKKFTFPKASPGTIIEFEYRIASLDFEKLDTWYFQREIPVIWSEIRFDVPTPFIYLVTFVNNRPLAPDEESVFGEKLKWLYNTKDRVRHFELANEKYLLYNTNESRYKVWALNNTRKKIVMKNLPGLAVVPDAQKPVSSYYPQLRFDLFESSGNVPRSLRPLLLTTHSDYERRSEWSAMHDPSEFIGYVHFRLKTWQQFNADLLEDERFGDFLRKSAGPVMALNENADELSRINTIYLYVQREYKWDGQFSLYASQGFKDFMEKKSGSSADLNLILINLFRQHGIKSDPVLIRTSDLGLPERMYPVKNQFNHVIASAEIGGKRYLFDVTSRSLELNKLNRLDIGTAGWVVNKDNPGWIETFPAENSKQNDSSPVFNL
jgi:hypothetical protein